METKWLWDRKVSRKELRKIFSDPESKRFIEYTALLLSRTNDPKLVFFDYIDSIEFCKKWSRIKKQMKKNNWSDSRTVYWQTIYERLVEKYKKDNKLIIRSKQVSKAKLCRSIGEQIK